MAKDLFELIRDDHDQVKSFLDKLVKSSPGAKKTREDLLDQLTTAFIPHMKAEESVFYPVLRENKETKELALEALEEHHIAENVLNELIDLDVTDETWLAKTTVFQEILLHHIEEEESEVFDATKDNFEQDQLDDIMNKFVEERDEWRDRLAA